MSTLSIGIGISAIIIGLIYRVPQMIQTYQTKSAKDLNSLMLWLQNMSYVLYVTYGVLQKDNIYIISSVISLTQNLLLLFMKYKFSSTNTVESNTSL